MKFVTPVNAEIQQMLYDMWHNQPVTRCRKRAPAILLSAKDYKIPQISQVLETERRAVSSGIFHHSVCSLRLATKIGHVKIAKPT